MQKIFTNNSFTRINIHDFNGSITIKNCISNNYYENNYDEILIVLQKFNLIKRIDEIVEERLNKPSVNNLKIDCNIPKVSL